MNFLKKQNSVILFLTAGIATFQILTAFEVKQMKDTIETLKPVVVECSHSSEVVEEVIPEPVPEELPARITCPLGDEAQQMILDRCKELNLDFAFTMAVIHAESSFNPNADSGSSVGLMQINRINHKWLSEELGITDFFNPEQNVKAGTYMLWQLFEKYDDPAKVLMAYNMGETGAKKLWNRGIYSTNYVEKVFQQQEIYNAEVMNYVHG